jgi:hypothetical protein
MKFLNYAVLNIEQEIIKEEKTPLLKDSIARAIITKVTQGNGSIRITDLPLDKQRSISTLARLYKFEDWGILRSELDYKEDGCERVFSPTELMTRILNVSI